MNKIEIYRTHIEIHDYTLGDSPKLENTFSVYDPNTHKKFPLARAYDEEEKILRLPRGMNIYWLENIFKCKAHLIKYNDEHKFIIKDSYTPKMKYAPRDDVQRTTIKFMCNIYEYENLYKYPQQSVNLDTGKGKSYCSIASIFIKNMVSIIITCRNSWLEQWRKYILQYTNIDPSYIKSIDGSYAINSLLNSDELKYRIYLVNHSTIKNYARLNGWRSIGGLFDKLNIGIKIYDEAHMNFENMCYIDYYTDCFKTYYVTATPDRSNNRESYLYKLYMTNVPSINLFDEINDPHAAYMAIKFNSHPTAIQAKKCKNAYGLDRNKYAEYIINNENFLKVSYILISKFLSKNHGKLLIYIGINKAIMIFKDWLENTFPELIGNVGIYTSLVENKRSQLEKRIILSTTKSSGAAVDIQDLIQVINLAEPFKSPVLAKQTFGRLRADNTLYIDVVDTGFYYTKKFYESKKRVYLKYATKCSEVFLDDKSLEVQYKNVLSKRLPNNEQLIYPIIYS